MQRSFETEILEGGELGPAMEARVHRRLTLTHKLLRNHAAILRALRRNEPGAREPVCKVLDIGCGHGALLETLRREMGVEVVGVDLRPPPDPARPFPILKLDAVHDALPPADTAVSVCLIHHLRDEQVIEMIRNVGRASRRFVILDLVRHWVPLALFGAAAPLCLPRVNVLDGSLSIRRAYTTCEFSALVERATKDIGATYRHTVAPLWIRQMADIRYGCCQ